jgi:hypothetical protein
VLFVAVDDISPGDILTIDYGMNHSVKVQYHEEYRAGALCHFFETHPFEQIVARLRELKKRTPKDLGWKRTLELEGLASKLRYLFQTPGALLHLLLKTGIRADVFFHWYQKADFRYFYLNYPFHPNLRQLEIMNSIDALKRFPFEGRSDCPMLLELLQKLRHRIFFEVICKGLERGEEAACLREEAFIWNEAFDAVQQENRSHVACKLYQSGQKDRLASAALHYARELRSSLVPWLEQLAHRPTPLSPAA